MCDPRTYIELLYIILLCFFRFEDLTLPSFGRRETSWLILNPNGLSRYCSMYIYMYSECIVFDIDYIDRFMSVHVVCVYNAFSTLCCSRHVVFLCL